MRREEYEDLGVDPDDRDHGYECGKYGYTPTRMELDQGSCPGCYARKQRGPACGHSACSQHYIDTGDTTCVED